MDSLEAAGQLDRGVEFLPDKAEMAARAKRGEGLARPELAVLLAYAKLTLYDALLASAVPDDRYLARELERYFPVRMRERFPDAVAGHRLRREIIATQLANAIVNRGGPAIVTRLVEDANADAPTIAAAYAATRDAFGLPELYGAIDELDGAVPGQVQLRLYAELQDLTITRIVWFVRNVDFTERGLEEVVGLYRDGIAEVAGALIEILPPGEAGQLGVRQAALLNDGVPASLAARLAALPDLAAAPDIVVVARRAGRPIPEVARIHFALDEMLRMSELAGSAQTAPIADHYDRLARDRAVETIATAHRRLTAEVIGRGQPGPDALAAWAAARAHEIERIRVAIDGIVRSGLTISKLTVAASLLGDLAKA
jgi:glutamate dehydrogenase